MAASNNSVFRDLLTGTFVAAVIAALVFFTVIVSGVDWLHSSDTVLRTVRFENIGALKVQDPVFVRGMKVGSVQSLTMRPDAVAVGLRLRADVPVAENYTVTVGQTSLLSGTCLNLDCGSGAPLPADIELKGTPPANLMDELGTLVGNLHKSLDPQELRSVITNINKASADIADISARLNRGEGMLGKLLSSDETAYNDLTGTLADLRTLTQDLRNGKGLLGKLLREEDTTYSDLHDAIANLKKVTGDLSDGNGFLGKLMTADDDSYSDFAGALKEIRTFTAKLNNPKTPLGRLASEDSKLMDDIEATAANFRSITAQVDSGKGTLGRLVMDDGISTEVEAAIKDVRQIIDNMRDTAPITTFTSIFFGGL